MLGEGERGSLKGRIRTHRTSDRGVKTFAKQLRADRTEAEALLWERLRRKALGGFRFRQQHPIGTYIADFYCNEAGLVVELDGSYHFSTEQIERDRMRDEAMRAHGLRILRISNDEVIENIETTLSKINRALTGKD